MYKTHKGITGCKQFAGFILIFYPAFHLSAYLFVYLPIGKSRETMLTIYQASAGSGKTYTLAKRYISLLLSQRQPHAHRSILAVTFTHKATNEMKSRIIRELHALGGGLPSAYRQDLMRENRCSADEINRRAGEILVDILQDYSSFAISTIDSFFQQVVRSFAREIGLPGSYNVALDSNDLLAQAIDQLFFELGETQNQTLLQWLTYFAEHNINEGKSWNPQKAMEDFGAEIFKENYQNILAAANKQLHEKAFLANYRKTLKNIRTTFEQSARQLGTEGLQLIQKYGLETSSFKGGSTTSPMKLFDKLATGEIDMPGDKFVACADDVELCYKASDPPGLQNAIENLHANGLSRLMHQVIELFGKDYKNYCSAKAIAGNLDVLGIMSDLSAYIRKVTEEQNIMPLAETPMLLHDIIDGSDTPFIYEKIGVRIRHYMIDEFQDTSAMQWQNFRPLIANSVSAHNENLVVGDVKQSIYRWRNSDWTLLDNIVPNDKALEPRIEVLDTNWRSKRDIVEFNNMLFRRLPEMLQSKLDESHARRLMHAYENLVQKSHQQENGYVQVCFIDENEDSGWKETALNKLLDQIRNAQERGIALHEMAILARTKADVQVITQFLIMQKVPVISSEGLLMSNAPAVRFLTGMLYVLADPSDAIHRTIVNFEYARGTRKLSYNEAILMATTTDELLFSQDEQEKIKQISHAPLFDIVQQIISVFNVYEWENAAIFVQAFADYVFDYITGHSSDLRNFMEFWEKNMQKATIVMPDVRNAIQVMTVHKAKGLEFKCVFVPFCEWNMDNHNRDTLWCIPNIEPFNRLSPVPVSYSSGLQDTVFATEYQEERMQNHIDSLNILYVAFTRPEQELYAFCPKPSKTDEKLGNKQISHLLWKCLSADIDEQGDYRKGIQSKCKEENKDSIPLTNDKLLQDLNRYGHDGINKTVRLRVKSPVRTSDEELSEENRLDLGIVMHEILCNIKQQSDQEKAIEDMVDSGRISRNEAGLVRAQLDKFWQMEGTAEWFSGKYQVLTEAEILTPDGSVYRPDRLMINGQEAVIVDYKFGDVKRPEHVRQVRTYMRLVGQMGYAVRGYLYYIEQNERIEVCKNTAGGTQQNLFGNSQ